VNIISEVDGFGQTRICFQLKPASSKFSDFTVCKPVVGPVGMWKSRRPFPSSLWESIKKKLPKATDFGFPQLRHFHQAFPFSVLLSSPAVSALIVLVLRIDAPARSIRCAL
jgi:hypothetical protein